MRRILLAATFAFTTAASLACGGTSQTVTSPSTVKCAVTANADPASFGPPGGTGTLAVTTNRECQWTASANGGWIQLGGTNGQGEGKVGFSVTKNNDPTVRRGAIAVGDQQVAITQEAAPCTFTVSPASDSAPPEGGRRTLSVSASSALCTWTARSEADWLTIVEGAQGTGNGQVVYDVRATDGPARTGTLIVAADTIAVTQGVGCATAITPTAQTVGASGGSGTVVVNTAPGCAWTAQSEAAWISMTSGQAGNGPGTVAFSVSAWDGPTRTGRLRVDTHVFTVTQTAGCSFNLSSSSASIAAGGGTGTVQVATAAGCSWTAASNAPWITITAGGSGSGPGDVRFSVLANTGPERNATLTAAGRTFTVTQGAGCTFSINPSSQVFASGGGSGSFAVTTGDGCGWNASASQPWVTITSGAIGSGGGTVQFTVEPNAAAARDATITVEGRTFGVHQLAGCSYSLSAPASTLPAEGGSGSVSFATGAECSWVVSSSDAWLRVTSATGGSGPATVQFAADANPGSARTATLTIAGQTHTVTQPTVAVACSYSISPTGQLFDAGGGSGSFAMTAPGSCAWNAASSDGWLQITAGASGSGNGTVSFSAAANTGPGRSATITAGGQTFTATQNSGCVVTISPAAQNFDVAGGSGTITVTAGDGCGWSASVTLGADWIAIASGASGSGPGSATFNVAANSGAARSGSITVGGQTFTITQAGV